MELLISILIGILFAIGTYMMLSRKLLRIIIGSAFMSHGTLLMLMTVGKLKRGAPPIVVNGVENPVYVDPIPQDDTERMRGNFDEH